MLFCLYVFILVLSSTKTCDIRKTKLYYIYDSESDSLTGIYQEKTYDVESGTVTDKSWNTTITGPILNDSTSFKTIPGPILNVTSTTSDLTSYNCPSGWIQYSRTTYNYCFYITLQNAYDWSTSEQACQSLNANLAGFQTSDELSGIADQVPVSPLLSGLSDTIAYGSYWWIGASRPTDSNCVNGSSTAPSLYNWTDAETTGTDGMTWGEGQPDCLGACVALRMAGTENVALNKTLDDVSCTFTSLEDYEYFWGYICGQQANLL